MKKISTISIIFLFLFFNITTGYSQSVPQSISFQAIARDSLDQPLSNREIAVEVSILKSSTSEIVWQETHQTETDDFGAFELLIGQGTNTSGGTLTGFDNIIWENDEYYLSTRVDFSAEKFGNGLIEMGDIKFQSVPYAFVAEKALNAVLKIEELTDVKLSGISGGQGLIYSGGEWINASVITADGTTDLSGDWTVSSNNITLTNGKLQANSLQAGNGTSINNISTDGIFSGTSDNQLATTKAIKTYVDKMAGSGSYWTVSTDGRSLINKEELGLLYQGTYDNTNMPDILPGGKLFFYPGKGVFRAGSISDDKDYWRDSNTGKHSAGFGRNTLASGDYSFTAGLNTTASGLGSVAFGENTQALGAHSVAFGEGNKSQSNHAVSFGINNLSNGLYSFTAGNGNKAYAESSVAFGTGSIAGETGISSEAYNCFAFGNEAKAKKEGSFVFGYQSTAWGKNSTAIGIGLTAASYGEVIVGMYNKPIDDSNAGAYEADDLIFGIGNGNGGSTSNAMEVYKNGHATLNGVWTANNFAKGSDRRLKKEIKPLKDGFLLKIRSLKPVTYYWDIEKYPDKGFNKREQIGLIAQDIQDSFPWLVQKSTEGYLSIDYSGFSVVLIKAIQEQQKQIDELQKKNSTYKDELQKIRQQYQALNERLKNIEQIMGTSSTE